MNNNSCFKLLLSAQLDVFKSRNLDMTYIRLSAETPRTHKVNKTHETAQGKKKQKTVRVDFLTSDLWWLMWVKSKRAGLIRDRV